MKTLRISFFIFLSCCPVSSGFAEDCACKMRPKTFQEAFQEFAQINGIVQNQSTAKVPTWEPVGKFLIADCNVFIKRKEQTISPVTAGTEILDGDQVGCENPGTLQISMMDDTSLKTTFTQKGQTLDMMQIPRNRNDISAQVKNFFANVNRLIVGKSENQQYQERHLRRESECRQEGAILKDDIDSCAVRKVKKECAEGSNHRTYPECKIAEAIGVRG